MGFQMSTTLVHQFSKKKKIFYSLINGVGWQFQRRFQILETLYLFIFKALPCFCLLYTSDAADEGLGVDLGGRRIIKKKIKEGSVEVVGVFVF